MRAENEVKLFYPKRIATIDLILRSAL